MKNITEDKYDVLIIGGGPIGLSCGIEAVKKGLSHIIIEKGSLVNSIYNFPANMTFFSTSERLELGDIPFISHGSKPTRIEALEYFRRVKQGWNLNVHTNEKALKISGKRGSLKVYTDIGLYRAANIILATGFYNLPNLMNIPGEHLPHVHHYFKDAHPFIDNNVTVIGGGNSAVDAALECFRKGAKVTLIVKKPELDKGIKYWVRPDIENRIADGSIKAFFNSTVTNIRENSVEVQTPESLINLDCDAVLAMTGFLPDTAFLSSAGIIIDDNNDKKPVYNADTFETNIPGIFVAGTVCGGLNTSEWYIENSRFHAEKVMVCIAGNK